MSTLGAGQRLNEDIKICHQVGGLVAHGCRAIHHKENLCLVGEGDLLVAGHTEEFVVVAGDGAEACGDAKS